MKYPIKLSHLTTLKNGQNDATIRCCNRLTKFNNAVEKTLRNLKSHGIISDFKFNSCCFDLKFNTYGEWKAVTHLAVLDFYSNVLKNVLDDRRKEKDEFSIN